MVVRCDLPAERGFALGLAPSLRERQEKALFAGEASDHSVGLAFQREEISVMRYQKSLKAAQTIALQ